MQIFRTPLNITPSEKKINYQSRLMLMGSCFSENIGLKLTQAKFIVDNNPFGIIFNPLSVKLGLKRLLTGNEYTSEDMVFHDQRWFSYDHHGRFSDTDPEKCLSSINKQLKESGANLFQADFLFVTFGTAYVYHLKKTGQVVANCHKITAKEFERKRLTVETIVPEFSSLLDEIWAVNPKLQVVFTVSPVRHLKDGAHENQISKSTLLIAIEILCNKYPQAIYFPSYEIMMDDLRDYRFYEEDMVHPNNIAISYIWNEFTRCFMNPETISLMKEIEKILQARNHRPFNAHSDQHKKFARSVLDQINRLQISQQIFLREEEEYFTNLLSTE